MLRGLPSALRPHRSMAMAWLMSAPRQSFTNRSSAARSSTATSSTATPPPVAPPAAPTAAPTAARTAAAQGVSTAMRAGTPQAASAAASSAVPTGPSVSGAATSPRGTKKPVTRPTLVAPASAAPAAASSPALAAISSEVLRPTSRQTSASMAARRSTLLLLGDIHSRPIGRRIVDQAVNARAQYLIVPLVPAEGIRSRLAVRDELQRLGEATRAVLRQEGRLQPRQLLIGGHPGHGNAAQQRMDVL